MWFINCYDGSRMRWERSRRGEAECLVLKWGRLGGSVGAKETCDAD